MAGHGWVTPNADGSVARCGGPGLCDECAREAADRNEQALLGSHGASAAPDLLAEVKRALAAATPGPRHCERAGGLPIVIGGDRVLIATVHSPIDRAGPDAHLIAHAPEWLAALVARVEELEARIASDGLTWGKLVAEKAAIEADERKRIVALLRERAPALQEDQPTLARWHRNLADDIERDGPG